MTHPDTLTIPRAVVEQALAEFELLLDFAAAYNKPRIIEAYSALRAALQPQAANKAGEKHAFNDESPFCVKCGSTGEAEVDPVAHILPRMLKILKFKSMPVPVDPLPYDNGEEKTVPLYTTPPATQVAPVSLQPAHDAVTIDTLNYRVMRQQSTLTAALEVLEKCVSKLTDMNEAYESEIVDGLITEGKAAIAQLEALKGPIP